MFDDRRLAQNRNIFLYGEINKETIREVMERIVYINEFDQDQLDAFGEKYHPEAIKLRICSGGGHVSPTVALVEEMIHSATPIITVCDGEICSAAFLIFICGHHRYLKMGSTVMMHPISSGFRGQLNTIVDDVTQYVKLEEYVQTIMTEQTEIPQEIIAEYYHTKSDRYFTEEDCLNYKICDDIYGHIKEEVKPEPKKKPTKKAEKKKKKNGKK